MKVQSLGYDWDDGNRGKCTKHGVSIKEIEAFFRQKGLYLLPDKKHSSGEKRYIAAGSVVGRAMLVVFILRARPAGVKIRPISARYMHKKERLVYEESS